MYLGAVNYETDLFICIDDQKESVVFFQNKVKIHWMDKRKVHIPF